MKMHARDEIEGGETMNKKIVLSLAASLAIAGVTFTAKTEAAGMTPCPAANGKEVKYTVQVSNFQEIEKWLQGKIPFTLYKTEKTKVNAPQQTTVKKTSRFWAKYFCNSVDTKSKYQVDTKIKILKRRKRD